MNDRTGTSELHSAYFDAIQQADEDLAEALGHVRAEEEARRITPGRGRR